MLSYTDALGAEQVSLTWRSMPPGTGGRGSYGHRHRTQEELYLVLAGQVTAKIGADEVVLGPGDAELVICSVRAGDDEVAPELEEDFWPFTG